MRVFKSPLFRATILFSFLLHGLILLVVYVSKPAETSKSESIEISLYPEGQILEALTRHQQQTIVKEALVPEKLKVPEDETLARFLSKEKQRVKEEMRAAVTGSTQNRANSATSPSAQSQRTQSSPPRPQAPTPGGAKEIGDGYEAFDASQRLQEMNRLDSGYSMVGESMPRDMKVGSFTALNTDRYLYYTFYARMEELIRYRWESRVQHVIDNLDRANLAALSRRNWVTQAEFLLDSKGELKKALLMKESGVSAFDAAAINAFQDARIFPNPPQEMIQDDGYIHIKFSFTVNYAPPSLVNRN